MIAACGSATESLICATFAFFDDRWRGQLFLRSRFFLLAIITCIALG